MEERRRAKLKEEMGVVNVQSRFLEENKAGVKEEVKVVESVKKEKKHASKRGRSVVPDKGLKAMATTADFPTSHSKDD